MSAKYLGETPVDISTDPRFASKTPSNWAMYLITQYSGIDGDHHQKWLVDQVARILMGTPMVVNEARWDDGNAECRVQTGEPSPEYLEWVEAMLGDDLGDGEREYAYDEGIAP